MKRKGRPLRIVAETWARLYPAVPVPDDDALRTIGKRIGKAEHPDGSIRAKTEAAVIGYATGSLRGRNDPVAV